MHIEVLRAFCLEGDRQEIGGRLEVDDRLARELIHNGKAQAIAAEAAPAVAGKPARGRKAAKS